MISKHILGTFDEALETLRNNVLMMASLTERSLENALKGLLQRDDDLCATAIADDEEIDQLEKQVDKDGIELLLRFQPVASDLRRVISAMKLCFQSGAHGRPGGQHRAQGPQVEPASAFARSGIDQPMREHAMQMFKDSVDAYVREDVELGRALKARDNALDENERVGQPPTD